jgi:hypothetical protein
MDEELNYTAVAFTNITIEDFTWEWGSKPYSIKAGETKFYPEFLARHLAKHLIDRILGDRLGNDDLRKEQEDKILSATQVEVSSEEPKEVVEQVAEPVEPFAELKEEVKEEVAVEPEKKRRGRRPRI